MKELMELEMVTDVQWAPTSKQLADCLTKAGANRSKLVEALSNGRLEYN